MSLEHQGPYMSAGLPFGAVLSASIQIFFFFLTLQYLQSPRSALLKSAYGEKEVVGFLL